MRAQQVSALPPPPLAAVPRTAVVRMHDAWPGATSCNTVSIDATVRAAADGGGDAQSNKNAHE
jgi:hypothetical protein